MGDLRVNRVLVDVGADDLVEVTWDEREQLLERLDGANMQIVADRFRGAGTSRPVAIVDQAEQRGVVGVLAVWRQGDGDLPAGIERLESALVAASARRPRFQARPLDE